LTEELTWIEAKGGSAKPVFAIDENANLMVVRVGTWNRLKREYVDHDSMD
jgi:hypothetical protein